MATVRNKTDQVVVITLKNGEGFYMAPRETRADFPDTELDGPSMQVRGGRREVQAGPPAPKPPLRRRQPAPPKPAPPEQPAPPTTPVPPKNK